MARKSDAQLSLVAEMLRERVTYVQDLRTLAVGFLSRPVEYNAKVVKKKWTGEAVNILALYASALKNHGDTAISATDAKAILELILEENGINIGRVMQSLRLAITGQGGGPDLMQIIEVLGANEVAERIEIALETLKDNIKE